MSRQVQDYLKELKMGPMARHQNLGVFPLFFESPAVPPHLSLDAALAQRLLEITEVSEGGEVPVLKVVNRGEIPILIIAGEELIGAKQNRMVNTTFLAAGGVTFEIPVSCVEQGRWSYRGKEFRSGPSPAPPTLRSKVQQQVAQSVREGQGFRTDQGAVWEEIRGKSARLAVKSPTGAMADIYQSYEEQLRRYTEEFTLSPEQKGFLVAVNDAVIGLEAFDSPASLARYFDKMMHSYALDAIDRQRRGRPRTDLYARAEGWIEEVKALSVAAGPSLGLGQDLRLESSEVIGAGLIDADAVLYLSIFAKNGAGSKTGMAQPSRRGSLRRPL